MDSDVYIDFLSKLASSCQQHTIERSYLKLSIYSNGKQSHILEDNYANKRVIAFCNLAKKLWAQDSSMMQALDAILSGSVKRSLDDMREAGADTLTAIKLKR